MKTIEQIRAERAAITEEEKKAAEALTSIINLFISNMRIASNIKDAADAVIDLTFSNPAAEALHIVTDHERLQAVGIAAAAIMNDARNAASEERRRIKEGAVRSYDAAVNEYRAAIKRAEALEEAIKENGPRWHIGLTAAACNLLAVQNIAVKVMSDNARAVFFAEALPAAAAVLEKYDGKKYGPKTAEKIREAMKARGYYFGMRAEKYHTTVYINPVDRRTVNGPCYNYEISYYKDARPLSFENNTINAMAIFAGTPYGAPKHYVMAICQAAAIQAAFEKVKEAETAFKEAAAAFNAMLPSGIENVSTTACRNTAVGREYR